MHPAPGASGKKGIASLARPRTAATTTVYDESRIKDKLKFLEEMEEKIETNIDDIVSNLDVFKIMSNRALQDNKVKEGVRLTKKMVLDASMCD